MPWKHNGKIIKTGKAWVADDGTKHPAVWMRWSDSQKKDKGLVWEDPPESQEPYDNNFYWGRQKDGTLIEKNLADINVVDDDGNPVIDRMTGKQLIELGLKSVWITQTKETANARLSKTDWVITRKTEKGTAIPDTITKYRDSIRTACDTIETKINNCSNLKEFMALFDTPVDGDGNATGNPPMFDFPKES